MKEEPCECSNSRWISGKRKKRHREDIRKKKEKGRTITNGAHVALWAYMEGHQVLFHELKKEKPEKKKREGE